MVGSEYVPLRYPCLELNPNSLSPCIYKLLLQQGSYRSDDVTTLGTHNSSLTQVSSHSVESKEGKFAGVLLEKS